ncbi:MAG: ATP-binding protein [Pseudomonadota bacterium]
MRLHLAARTHAFLHGLFRPADERQTRALHEQVHERFQEHGLLDADARIALAVKVAEAALLSRRAPPDNTATVPLASQLLDLLEYEGMFELPTIDWDVQRTVSQWWALRDELTAQQALVDQFAATEDALTELAAELHEALAGALPRIASADPDAIRVPTPRLYAISDLPSVVERVATAPFETSITDRELLPRLRDRLERNLIEASGGNPADPASFKRAPRLPSKSDLRDPEELVGTYLNGTPLVDLFAGDVDITIPTASRFEHHHLVAGSGHGKTQTLQYLIAKDLEAVAAGRRSVIVLDSQGDLIRNIAQLKLFAPGEPLHDRVVIIDPTDIEYPVSLNLFDVGLERLDRYSPLDRERLLNSILELYDFVLGSLLSAEMTQKQSVIFRYVTRLMLHIPDATIHTLREVMEPGAEQRFADSIAALSGSARRFFETEFVGREFEQTKKQVLRRLWGILENQTFERMFSHPRSKLDLFAEMNAGKVILINTAKDLLKETGTEIFGRFFIAMITQVAQERATLPEHARTPTLVYIDEAADYFDRNIGVILSQARKYGVGLVLAHQYLGQLEPKLQDAIAANTAIKFAGGVSNKDARALAPMLGCDAGLIERQPKLSFAASIRGVTPAAAPLQFPVGYLEALPRMSAAERAALRDRTRERYAQPAFGIGHAAEDQVAEEPEPPSEAAPPEPPTTDPTAPTASW